MIYIIDDYPLLVSSVAFLASACAATVIKRQEVQRSFTRRPLGEEKSTRLVRYLSDQHDWHQYSKDEELFVQEFPKVELHVHLDGAFDPDFLFRYMKKHPQSLYCLPVETELLWEEGRKLEVRRMVQECQTAKDFHKLCTCRGYRSLKSMLNCFEIFLPLVRRNLDLIEQLAFDFCQRQWEQNVLYTEVRYSPHLLAESYQGESDSDDDRREVDADMVFLAVTRGLRRGCRKFNITINQILCAITWRPDWALSTLEIVKKYLNAYPCAAVGIDVAAGEEHFNKQEYPHLYGPHFEMAQRAKAEGVPLTMHAGESTDHAMDNVRRAISEYGARRIGHGYRMVNSRELLKQVRDNNVHVEVCPTSSLETGGWVFDKKDWKLHPVVVMRNMGVSYSLSSDDPAVFHTSLAWQYRIALAKMEFTKDDLIESNLQAIEHAFCSDDEKERLRGVVIDYSNFKRLRSNVSSRDDASSINRRQLWRRAMSEGFADRVYLTGSQYF